MIELWNESTLFRMMLILVPTMIVISWSLWYLIKQHDKVLAGFETIKQELLTVKTKEELNLGIEHAIKWSKTCFHASHSNLVSQINLIIQIKREQFND